MDTSDDVYAAAFSAAITVAVVNAMRGLLAAETELNPEVEAIAVVFGKDSSFEVTCTDGKGRPVGGYRI